jgi:hypothetical protein
MAAAVAMKMASASMASAYGGMAKAAALKENNRVAIMAYGANGNMAKRKRMKMKMAAAAAWRRQRRRKRQRKYGKKRQASDKYHQRRRHGNNGESGENNVENIENQQSRNGEKRRRRHGVSVMAAGGVMAWRMAAKMA